MLSKKSLKRVSRKRLERVYHVELNDAFDKYLLSKDSVVFKTQKVLEAVNFLLEEALKREGENMEYYKDHLDDESIDFRIEYISDRWNCVGRLNFLKNRVILS